MGDRISKRERPMPMVPASTTEVSYAADIENAAAKLKKDLSRIPQVVKASLKTTCDKSDRVVCNKVRAWILVDRYDDSTIDEIYQIEQDLLQQYESLDFDLNVVASSAGSWDTQLPGDDAYLRQ
jgi:predicted nucleotidyltransferase